MAPVKQANFARHLLFHNHVKMYKIHENLAAKLVKGGCPPPAWSLAPKVVYFYTENTSFSDGGGLSWSKMNENLAAKLGKGRLPANAAPIA